MKTINISDIKIKELNVSQNNGQITIEVVYSLFNDNQEIQTKRDIVKDEELTAAQKTKVNDILTVVSNKIKTKEGI